TENLPGRGYPYRCFGEHLAWPTADTLVLSQDLLQISLSGRGFGTIWNDLIHSVQAQEAGSPDIGARGDGFFPAFPLSLSYSADAGSIAFDGVVVTVDGNRPTLALFVAQADG